MKLAPDKLLNVKMVTGKYATLDKMSLAEKESDMLTPNAQSVTIYP